MISVHTTPARQQLALLLAIEWSDPDHQTGLNAHSKSVLDFLNLLNTIYLKHPDLENIPVYDYEAPTHRAELYLNQNKFQRLIKKLEHCSYESLITTSERKGPSPGFNTKRERNYFLSSTASPKKSCREIADPLSEFAITQLTVLEFTDQQQLYQSATLHSSLAQDMQYVVNRILQNELWQNLLDGLKVAQLPRQQNNYESQIEIKLNSSPLTIIFKENNTVEKLGTIQTVWRHHTIEATKNELGVWAIERQEPRDEIISTSL